jgi:LAT3 family solute carrier family 43 protein 3
MFPNERTASKCLIICCFVTNLLFSGVIFGWPTIQLLMIEDRIFSNLCAKDEAGCPAQVSSINLVYTIASSCAIISSFLTGFLVDKYGFIPAASLACLLNTAGYLMFAYSSPQSLGEFIVAVALFGCGGSLNFFCTFPVAFSVDRANLGIVLSGGNCFFDCSAVISLCFYRLYLAGYSREGIFLSYAIITVLVYAVYIFLWLLAQRTKESTEIVHHTIESMLYGDQLLSDSVAYETVLQSSASKTFSDQGWLEQLKSYYFVFVAVFISLMMLRSNMYLGTSQQLLEMYGDAHYDYLFTQLFLIILPFGFLFMGLIDTVMKRYGFASSFQVVVFSGFFFAIISIIPLLFIQVVAFIIYCGHRAFLYALLATYNAHMFGPRNAGRIHGCVFLIGGIVNLLQYPIVLLLTVYADGNVYYLYVAFVVLCIPLSLEVERGLRPLLAEKGGTNDIKEEGTSRIIELASQADRTATLVRAVSLSRQKSFRKSIDLSEELEKPHNDASDVLSTTLENGLGNSYNNRTASVRLLLDGMAFFDLNNYNDIIVLADEPMQQNNTSSELLHE